MGLLPTQYKTTKFLYLTEMHPKARNKLHFIFGLFMSYFLEVSGGQLLWFKNLFFTTHRSKNFIFLHFFAHLEDTFVQTGPKCAGKHISARSLVCFWPFRRFGLRAGRGWFHIWRRFQRPQGEVILGAYLEGFGGEIFRVLPTTNPPMEPNQ